MILSAVTVLSDMLFLCQVRGLCGDMDGSVVGELKSRRGIEESVIPFAMSYSSCLDQSENAILGSDWCTPDPKDVVGTQHCNIMFGCTVNL